MKVKNINGTTQSKCKCGSWLKHWHNFSGQYASRCRAAGCSNPADLGAHVNKDVPYDNKWYIVPFCYLHNRATRSVELNTGTILVPANKRTTCEK